MVEDLRFKISNFRFQNFMSSKQHTGRPSCSACNGSGLVAGAVCVRCGDVIEQARDWLLLKCPPSVSGQGGHSAAFAAACALVGGFGLSGGNAEVLLREWNGRCDPPWSEKELAHKLRGAERARDAEAGYLIWKQGRATVSADVRELRVDYESHRRELLKDAAKARPFDVAALRKCILPGVAVDRRFLAERSVVDVACGPSEFLNALYSTGERVLVFSEFYSQGNWCFERGASARDSQWWLLGKQAGQASVKCGVPELSQREGVWFLALPVSGRWVIQKGYPEIPAKDGRPGRKAVPDSWTRRSECNTTAYRFMVIESDEPGIEADWLNFLCGLPLPIVALYTSGGRSVHALLRIDAQSKAAWDAFRDFVRPLLTKCGADKGVFSAVRLTRLPGFWREGTMTKERKYFKYAEARKQELLYLNPGNHGERMRPIYQQARIRVIARELVF